MLYAIPRGHLLAQFSHENSVDIRFVGFHRCAPSCLYLVTDPRRSRLIVFSTVTVDVRFNDQFDVAWFHPQHEQQIIFSSAKALGVYNAGDETVAPIPVPNYSKFSGFVYSLVDASVMCAASGRDLLFFQDLQHRHTVTITEDSPIVFLSAYTHGFIIATEGNRISFVQHALGFKDFSKSFQQGTAISYGIAHPIVWASFSPSGHQMVCNVDNRQLIVVNTREFESNTENSIVNPNIVSHKGPVAAISSCAYKPLFVSCGSEDKTVIVWDYSKQTAVLHQEFTESLTDVSFHPSGDLLDDRRIRVRTATIIRNQ
jgi:hypothetical protein